jgi:hypothetical protein
MLLQLRPTRWLKKLPAATGDVLVLMIDDPNRAALDLNFTLTSRTPDTDFLRHMWRATAPHPGAPNPVVETTRVTLAVQTSYVALSAEAANAPQGQYAEQLKLSLNKDYRPQINAHGVQLEGVRQLLMTPIPLPAAVPSLQGAAAPQPTGYSNLLNSLAAAPRNRRKWYIKLQLGGAHNAHKFISGVLPFKAVASTTWGDHRHIFEDLPVLMARVPAA